MLGRARLNTANDVRQELHLGSNQVETRMKDELAMSNLE